MSKISPTPGEVASFAPTVTRLLRTLGEPVTLSTLNAFAQSYGDERLEHLLDGDYCARNFWLLWQEASRRNYWELFELLMLERWLCSQPALVSKHLPRQTSLAATLHAVRRVIALALYARAKELNWREPLTFVRALQIAERYLRWAVANGELGNPNSLSQLEGRLGVCLVLRSRYEDLAEEDLRAASEWILSSLSGGSALVGHEVYYGEAQVRLFDAVRDVNILLALGAWFDDYSSPKPAQLVAIRAEVWLRLGDEARSGRSAVHCWKQAAAVAESVPDDDALGAARAMIVQGLAKSRLARQGDRETHVRQMPLQGLRLPFGLKRQARAWVERDRRAAREDLGAVAREFENCAHALRSQPLCRRVAASVSSVLAGTEGDTKTRLQRLAAATGLRAGTQTRSPLKDPESRLENAVDLIAVYELTQRQDALLDALVAVLQLADFDQAWPTPLLLLAQQVERLGQLSLEMAYELRKLDERGNQDVLRLVLSGDAESLYAMAASRALESREIDRRHLGGRSGAFVAADYSGLIDEVFVFKPTTLALAEREDGRAQALGAVVRKRGLEGRFSFPRTLARSPLPLDDPLRERNCEVLVARQFHQGEMLAEHIRGQDRIPKLVILESALDFLALIHAAEYDATLGQINKARKELKKQELGRWLRDGLRLENSRQWFDEWFSAFPTLPMLARRDAHPYNWLITPAKEVIALDLEACGWRPVGYELAQLLEDVDFLPIDRDGWKDRRRLVRRYARALTGHGVVVDTTLVQHAYELAALARGVRTLTEPAGDRQERRRATQLLQYLKEPGHVLGPHVSQLSAVFLEAWTKRVGVATASGVSLTGARRRHLSRAMAFELRHGTRVHLNNEGWAYVASVADALNAAGLATSKAELLAVAAAVDEPRFERGDGDRQIRARYGHTRKVEISYPPLADVKTLYHGTATTSLEAVFTRQEGLLPQGRLWVHLSDDPGLAVRTAQRHGPGVLLAWDGVAADAVGFAGGTTYLADAVPPARLRIVTPLEENAMGLM
ncbi:MAG: RNA 2'-phosphotransferase [Actinobacteria bacterium]|nr:RNA 2'-phosphotransferase [Actinomycetota bacterium]